MRKITLKIVSLWLVILSLTFFVGCRLITKEKAIHKAAYKGDLEKVKKIIGKDPTQINVQDWCGFTPLYLASSKGPPVAVITTSTAVQVAVPLVSVHVFVTSVAA